jgi:hypothetical protein
MSNSNEHLSQVQDPSQDNLDNELANLPEKFKGKSPSDIVKMYLDLEQEKSRLGNELGELRRKSLLEVEPTTKQTKEEVKPHKIETDELLTNPNEALDKVIETHPAVVKAKETAEELERQVAHKTFASEYPDYQKDLNDPNFVEWVKKNPVRQNLIMAANNYDLNSARALWQMWGEHKELAAQAAARAAETARRAAEEKAGILEGSTGNDTRTETVYSRAELRELHRKALLGDKAAQAKWNDPKFKQQRMAAYQEERVQ